MREGGVAVFFAPGVEVAVHIDQVPGRQGQFVQIFDERARLVDDRRAGGVAVGDARFTRQQFGRERAGINEPQQRVQGLLTLMVDNHIHLGELEIGGGVFGRVPGPPRMVKAPAALASAARVRAISRKGRTAEMPTRSGFSGCQSCRKGADIFFESAVEDGDRVALGAHITGEVEKA